MRAHGGPFRSAAGEDQRILNEEEKVLEDVKLRTIIRPSRICGIESLQWGFLRVMVRCSTASIVRFDGIDRSSNPTVRKDWSILKNYIGVFVVGSACTINP